MKKHISTYIVDSFTSEPFKGNPAGVCLLDDVIEECKMLSIAKELGFSETAFVRKSGEEGGHRIRYFSPKMEIPLCGHATLAAAKVLFTESPILDEIHFETIENISLIVARDQDQIVMQFPLSISQSAEAPPSLLKALGIRKMLNCEYNMETKILLIEIESSKVLRALAPDFPALLQSHEGINGVLVTAESKEPEYDFESRYFWPWSGTFEDPVTGGTHTFLAPYWAKKLGKSNMKSFQCSERTGFMIVSITENHGLLIKGQAQIVFQGQLLVS